MVKTHLITNLKYLCVTTKKDHHEYKGSGKSWRRHLQENGSAIKTELIYESNNWEEFSNVCIKKSVEFDVVNSTEWANEVIERGGGEYPVDNNGKRIVTIKKSSFSSEEEMLEFCKNSKWFECSICKSIMTENAFYGTIHRKCKANADFQMIPYNK